MAEFRPDFAQTKENIIFLTEQEVKALFSDFELIQFNEIEKDAIIASGEKKHWHIYDIIAQKKSNIFKENIDKLE